jgi:hypothetical protein
VCGNYIAFEVRAGELAHRREQKRQAEQGLRAAFASVTSAVNAGSKKCARCTNEDDCLYEGARTF